MTDEQQQPEAKPFYRRWWFAALGVVVILAALANLGEGEESEPVAAGTTTTTISDMTTTTTSHPLTTSTTTPVTTTTTPPPTTTTQPTTTTTAAPVEGSGDGFFEFSVAGDEAAVLDITHQGTSNFAVTTYDANNERLDLLVNEIGSYTGRVPVNFFLGEEVAFIEINASGPWRIQTLLLSELPFNFGSASGSGDDVVVVEVSSPSLDITHDGGSNFAVTAWTDGRDLLVNEIGSYDATVRSPTGTVVFEIIADGNWTLTGG